jgi:protein O-mannosyl-transferase
MSRIRKSTNLPEHEMWNRYAPLAVCVFLVAVVALVFSQTVGHDFVNYDDRDYVYENYHVSRGLTPEAVAWATTTGHACNWHPVTWLSHILDCQFYDLKAGGHHFTSVLLHAANAVLLFLVFWRMTGDLWPSAFVAAVFAVHPLRVESVAWVADRKDVLSGLFFMLTLAAYLAYVRRPFSFRRYLTVVLCFALGLMSKPVLVTVPFVLLLLDYWPLGRVALPRAAPIATGTGPVQESAKTGLSPLSLPRLIAEKIPLLLLVTASCVVTFCVQTNAIVQADRLPLASRLGNALVSYASYLAQFFWPVDMAVFYPHPGDGLPTWKVVGSLVVLLMVSAGVLACWRRIPCLTVGWLWYLGMLVPMIGIVQVGSQCQADRYTYLPQIGLLIALAWGAKCSARSWPYRNAVYGVASAVAIVLLVGCARYQTAFWRNSVTLWNRALDCTTGNGVANTNLGAVLTSLGQYDQALWHLQQALDIQPSSLDARVNLGEVLARLKQYDAAREQYEAALEIDPDCVEAHHNLGMAWARQGRLAEAIPHYRRAIAIDPACTDAYANLGVALQLTGNIDEAEACFEKALELAIRQDKRILAENLRSRLRQIAERGVAPHP